MPDRNDIYFMFFDTETTGLPITHNVPSSWTYIWPRMVQLSWIAQDMYGNTISRGNHIIRPAGYAIPEEASMIHGITTERALAVGSDLKKTLKKFWRDAEHARYLVCHNADFDTKVLGCEFYRIFGEDWLIGKESICTMLASTEYCDLPGYYGPKWPTLQELHETLFGFGFEDPHNSNADVEATMRCFWELCSRGVI